MDASKLEELEKAAAAEMKRLGFSETPACLWLPIHLLLDDQAEMKPQGAIDQRQFEAWEQQVEHGEEAALEALRGLVEMGDVSPAIPASEEERLDWAAGLIGLALAAIPLEDQAHDLSSGMIAD